MGHGDVARHGTARGDVAQHGTARHEATGLGVAWHGTGWGDVARRGTVPAARGGPGWGGRRCRRAAACSCLAEGKAQGGWVVCCGGYGAPLCSAALVSTLLFLQRLARVHLRPRASLPPPMNPLLFLPPQCVPQVYGPESSMTGICKEAIDYVKSFDK